MADTELNPSAAGAASSSGGTSPSIYTGTSVHLTPSSPGAAAGAGGAGPAVFCGDWMGITDLKDYPVNNIDFETLRPGMGSEVQEFEFTNKNISTMTFSFIPSESESQEGSAIDTYLSHYLSLDNITYSPSLEVELDSWEVINIYTYYQPPSNAGIGEKEWKLEVTSDGFLTDWDYYSIFEVRNTTATTETDTTITVTIPYSNGYMRSDFGDIRFYDAETEIDYMILSKTDSSIATFLLLIPSLAGYSSKHITVYSGNSTVTADEADPSTMYLFYDDFPGTSFDPAWTVTGTGASVSDGMAILDSGSYPKISYNLSISPPYIVEARYQHPNTYRNRMGLGKSGWPAFDYGIFSPSIYWNGWTGVTLLTNTWYRLIWKMTTTTYYWEIWDDAKTTQLITRNTPLGTGNPTSLFYGGYESTSSDMKLDYVSIRKIAAIDFLISSLDPWTTTQIPDLSVKGSLHYQSQDLPGLDVKPRYTCIIGGTVFE
jgi:hypothetical protein